MVIHDPQPLPLIQHDRRTCPLTATEVMRTRAVMTRPLMANALYASVHDALEA
jgi:hypothetical protein